MYRDSDTSISIKLYLYFYIYNKYVSHLSYYSIVYLHIALLRRVDQRETMKHIYLFLIILIIVFPKKLTLVHM